MSAAKPDKRTALQRATDDISREFKDYQREEKEKKTSNEDQKEFEKLASAIEKINLTDKINKLAAGGLQIASLIRSKSEIEEFLGIIENIEIHGPKTLGLVKIMVKVLNELVTTPDDYLRKKDVTGKVNYYLEQLSIKINDYYKKTSENIGILFIKIQTEKNPEKKARYEKEIKEKMQILEDEKQIQIEKHQVKLFDWKETISKRIGIYHEAIAKDITRLIIEIKKDDKKEEKYYKIIKEKMKILKDAKSIKIDGFEYKVFNAEDYISTLITDKQAKGEISNEVGGRAMLYAHDLFHPKTPEQDEKKESERKDETVVEHKAETKDPEPLPSPEPSPDPTSTPSLIPTLSPTPISLQSQPAKPPQEQKIKKPFYYRWFSLEKGPTIVTPSKTVEEKDKKSPSSISISQQEEENKKNIQKAMQETISELIRKITIASDASEAQIELDLLINQLIKYKKQCEELDINYDTVIGQSLNNLDFTKKAKEILTKHYLLNLSHTERKVSPPPDYAEEEKNDYAILGKTIQEEAKQEASTIKQKELEIIERIDNELFLTSHDYRQETERMLEEHNDKRLSIGIEGLHLNSKIEHKKDIARKILADKISSDLLKKHIEKRGGFIIKDQKKFSEECKGLDIKQVDILLKANKKSMSLIEQHDEILSRFSNAMFISDPKYRNDTIEKLEKFKAQCEKREIDCYALTVMGKNAKEIAEAQAKPHNRFSFWPPASPRQSESKEKKIAAKNKPKPPTSARGGPQSKR